VRTKLTVANVKTCKNLLARFLLMPDNDYNRIAESRKLSPVRAITFTSRYHTNLAQTHRESKGAHMSPRLPRHVAILLFVIGVSLVALNVTPRPVEATGPALGLNAEEFDKLCQDILTRALTLTEQGCSATGRNQACYGYTTVQAKLQPGMDPSSYPFLKGGDIQPVKVLETIHTSPLDVAQGTWGMAMLKIQANLPDTNPGQNVTFILFGDTNVQPDPNRTNAFYLSTNLGKLACRQVPQNSLMVRAPNNVTVTFEINGVQISASSVVVLRTAPTGEFLVRTMEGHVAVTAHNVTQQIWAGQELTVPMAGPDFRSPAGPPSAPVSAPWETTLEGPTQLVNTLDPTADKYSGLITLEGPIEAVNDNIPSLTIYGQVVRINKVGCWRYLKPGDWVHVEGVSLGYIIQANQLRSTNPACIQDNVGGAGGQSVSGGDPSEPKITICHVPPGNVGKQLTLTIGVSAWKANGSGSGGHGPGLHGGDHLGPCNNSAGKANGKPSDPGKGGGKK
jgi:hypothetical protein